jgi:hypothetical protein
MWPQAFYLNLWGDRVRLGRGCYRPTIVAEALAQSAACNAIVVPDESPRLDVIRAAPSR